MLLSNYERRTQQKRQTLVFTGSSPECALENLIRKGPYSKYNDLHKEKKKSILGLVKS